MEVVEAFPRGELLARIDVTGVFEWLAELELVSQV
jgi:hypothetical protein